MRTSRLQMAAVTAMLAVALAGCASIVPKLEAPTLAVTTVVIGGGNSQAQQIRLTFHATNPNDRAIAIRSIECNLELEGAAFAQGTTDAAFTLPALGQADFDLNLTANLNSVLAALAGGFGHHTVDYRVYGKVHLQGGVVRTIPFDQKGRVRL
ncbi:MAG TPA: LEA type 2 family protein [Steroidobacteraceae bacterium]|nr:LEA type 2 family protein [Steroidobacteraceae bacterium]